MPKVLIVDDSADDRFLFSRALRKSGLNGSVVEVEDGERAIAYLQCEPPPAFVLLDLKMPKISGFEVLEWLQAKHMLESFPVVVFTSSPIEKDREKAMKLGATEYLVKTDYFETCAAVTALKTRYLGKASPLAA